MEIDKIFDSFLNKEVPVEIVKHTTKVVGEIIDISTYEIEEDTFIKDIEKLALENGLIEVRVWLPDTIGTCDYIPSRLNVYINSDSDGKFIITKFNLG